MNPPTIHGRIELPRKGRLDANTNEAPRRGPDRAPERRERQARQLALAHLIERKISDGSLANYAEAARRLGVTRPRVAVLVALAWKPVEVQELALVR